MSTVAEIKAAVQGLPKPERLALFRWLEETEEVRADKLAALRADIAAAVAQADHGELISADETFRTLRANPPAGT